MSQSTPLPSGRIDLHSHLLPGVDDGCRTYEEALECIRQLLAHGYTGSVCTPHITRESYPENTPPNIARAVEQLRARVAEAGLEYTLWPGGEIRISKSTVAWLDSVGVPTLGAGRWVLVDHWGPTWPTAAEELFAYLSDRGYRVLLAHPERMELLWPALESVIERAAQLGVLLQGNLNSFSGQEGPRAAALADAYLAADQYFVLASDVHHPLGMTGRFEALVQLEQRLGRERLDRLLAQRPAEILCLGD